MEKRYQVFVSSTYNDLQDERKEVIQALLELDCIPAGMELFPAADDDQWTLIKKVIEDCDYYIVVIAGRYGTLSAKGSSYTQIEYEYALSIGKPIIAFLHREPGAIAASKTEQSEEGRKKLEQFRELVQQKMCKHWSNPSELGSVVSRSLVKLIKQHPAVGWVRADQVADETASKEILRLQKRIEELRTIIEKNHREGPAGTENLAQGEEIFQIRYQYQLRYSSELEFLLEKPEFLYSSMPGTWNDIFAAIAPPMIDEAAEATLRKTLDEFVTSRELGTLQLKHTENRVIADIRTLEDDFQTIKIQLRALGLIAKSERTRSIRDNSTYWTLTPYGDNVLTRLRAIRREQVT